MAQSWCTPISLDKPQAVIRPARHFSVPRLAASLQIIPVTCILPALPAIPASLPPREHFKALCQMLKEAVSSLSWIPIKLLLPRWYIALILAALEALPRRNKSPLMPLEMFMLQGSVVMTFHMARLLAQQPGALYLYPSSMQLVQH